MLLTHQSIWEVISWKRSGTIVLRDAMDGSLVTANSAVEVLTGLAKALQSVNRTTWHETFLCLWISALRLVQRERDPSEGPVPRLDTCLCMLLSMTTLVIACIIDEEEAIPLDKTDHLSNYPSLKTWGLIILWFTSAPVAHRWDVGPLYVSSLLYLMVDQIPYL